MLPTRPLPKETIEGLIPPARDFPYFEHADAVPFQPTAARLDPARDVNAWWLADASLLVYGDATFARNRFESSPLPRLGFTIDWIRDGDDLRALALAADDALVVAFRGTKLLLPGGSQPDPPSIVDLVLGNEDLRIDGRFFPSASRAGGLAHSGFLEMYARISDRLDEILAARRPGQKLWLTGHSLGGALAVLAAAHLGDDAAIEGIYTYGCPRVGDRAFVDGLPSCVHCRFVHRDDLIPQLPPSWPFPYVDAGELRAVPDASPRALVRDLTEGFGHLISAFQRSVREGRLEVGAIPFSVWGLADHAPVYYASLLWNAVAAT